MNEQTKSIIRHILTALGFALTFIGLGRFTGLLDYITQNLDTIWDAVLVLVGVVTTIFGYFKGRPAGFSKGQ
jgi:cytochrome c biogenesis protein CcdA